MKSVFFLSFLCLLPWVGLAQGHVTGTGGDGFFFAKTQKLYLRDLYEVNLTEFTLPEQGLEDPDNVMLNSVSFFLPQEMFVQNSMRAKLAQKILKIDETVLGFGSLLVHALRLHTFVFSDVPLSEIPDEDPTDPESDGSFYQLPIDAEFRQIANRSGTTIRIHRPSWLLLSDEHRIALLLHEAIYSLLKPQVSSAGFQYQSSLKAREITGFLFTQDFDLRGAWLLPRMARDFLNLHWYDLGAWKKRLNWSVILMNQAESTKVEFTSPILMPRRQLLHSIQKICEMGVHLQSKVKSGKIVLVNQIDRPAFLGEFFAYQTRFGYHQALRFHRQREGKHFFSFWMSDTTEAECIRQVRETTDQTIAEI